jgi:hypothetical protein
MASLLEGSEFAKAIQSANRALSDRQLRKFVFDYCHRYQEMYWFEQLKDAFAYLELTLTNNTELLENELSVVKSDVEMAMGEYWESLNEVAIALYRLLDDTPLTVSDALQAVGHVWHAYSCNELPKDFVDREDAVLCQMLETLTNSDVSGER